MDFGWPNVEISQKMANGQLLFLALELIRQSALIIGTLISGWHINWSGYMRLDDS